MPSEMFGELRKKLAEPSFIQKSRQERKNGYDKGHS